MDDNIKITKEEIKLKLELELLELKKEISNILLPEKKTIEINNEILEILREREILVEESLERLKNDNFLNCIICKEKIEDKRFFIDPTVKTCLKHNQN